MTQPRLGRVDSRPGTMAPWSRAKTPTANVGSVLCQGHFSAPAANSAGSRLVVERGERLAGLDLARGDELGHGKRLDAPRLFPGIDIRHRRVRRAQIEPDDISTGGRCRRTAMFHRRLRSHAALVPFPAGQLIVARRSECSRAVASAEGEGGRRKGDEKRRAESGKRTKCLSAFRFGSPLSAIPNPQSLVSYNVQPFRYSRRTYWLMAGRLVHFMLGPSQSSFLPTPARIARLPKRTISVSGPP